MTSSIKKSSYIVHKTCVNIMEWLFGFIVPRVTYIPRLYKCDWCTTYMWWNCSRAMQKGYDASNVMACDETALLWCENGTFMVQVYRRTYIPNVNVMALLPYNVQILLQWAWHNLWWNCVFTSFSMPLS